MRPEFAVGENDDKLTQVVLTVHPARSSLLKSEVTRSAYAVTYSATYRASFDA
jgi:hypothetical protein